MDNNELATAFATECLGWVEPTLSDDIRVKDFWVEWEDRENDNYGPLHHKSSCPFGEDTTEGWAAHKQWVEPWIKEKGLRIAYDSGDDGVFTLYSVTIVLKRMIEVHAIANGPLPTAAIKACLELVRKEKGDGSYL